MKRINEKSSAVIGPVLFLAKSFALDRPIYTQ